MAKEKNEKSNLLMTEKMSVDDLSAFKSCIVYFTSILMAFIFGFSKRDRQNQYVRFNAFQALFLLAAFVVLTIVFGIFIGIFAAVGVFGLLIVFNIILFLCYVFLLIVLIFTAYKAYEGEMFVIPLIGGWAKSIVYGKEEKQAEPVQQEETEEQPAEEKPKKNNKKKTDEE